MQDALLIFISFAFGLTLAEAEEIPSGKLGHPLGTYLTIEGVRAEQGSPMGNNYLIVDTVNGKKWSIRRLGG